MSIRNFFKTHIPSFEDEFVQSDEERAIENAPNSTRRGSSRNVPHIGSDPESIEEKDWTHDRFSLSYGLSNSADDL